MDACVGTGASGGIRAVIVDAGGVLEDTPSTGWVRRWERRLGLGRGGLAPLVSPVWQEGRVGAASLAAIEQRTATVLGLDPEASRRLWSDVWEEYLGTLNDDLFAYLAALRPAYKTAILSNSFVGAREREQQRYDFEDAFDAVVYSHEEGVEKPDPAIYLLACRRLGVRPQESLFLDDDPANIHGARDVGMHAVLFESVEQAIGEIRRRLAP